MNSHISYNPSEDITSLTFNYGRKDIAQSTYLIYTQSINRAEKLLSKLFVRRFLATYNIDELVKNININEIIARNIKIHADFK